MNNLGNAPRRQGNVSIGHPVNVATGVLYHDFEDSVFAGRIPLVFPRRYSTALLEKEVGIFGSGWHCPLEMKISRDLDGYVVTDPSGEAEIYFNITNQRLNDGEVARNLGAFHELKILGNELRVTHWDADTGDITHDFYPMAQGDEWPPISRRENAEGNALLFRYDDDNQLIEICQKREKRSLKFAYDESGLLIEVYRKTLMLAEEQQDTRPWLQYNYDEQGRLIKFTDPLGDSSHYKYDDAGRMINERTLAGLVYTFRFDGQGLCNYLSGKNDFDLHGLKYDSLSRITEVTNSQGHTTIYHWNDYNQVEKVISPTGRMSSTIYDDFGRVISEITPGGAAKNYKYDENGNQCNITSPDGSVLQYTFNSNHQVTVITDPLGNQWSREYDENGHQINQSNPLQGLQVFVYDDRGDLIKHRDSAGNERQFKWDEYGNLSSAIDWDGRRTSFSWDAYGDLIARREAAGNVTQMTRDRLGHLLELKFSDGNKRTYEWDAYDNLESYTDENGISTQRTYCACGNIEEELKSDGHKISYGWNTVPGQLAYLRNEKGELYQFEYDEDARLVQETDFSGAVTQYEFNSDGQKIVIRKPSGQVIRYQRDAVGRITTVLYDDGSKVDYEYDVRGLLSKAVNKDCPVSFEYDELGRLIRETQGDHVIEHEYDQVNNRILRKSSLGDETAFTWNPGGQIASIKAGQLDPIKFTYDSRGYECERMLGSGIVFKQQVDQRGRLVEQTLNQESGHSRRLMKRSYQYDAAGNLLTKQDSKWGVTKYTYDVLERIESTLHPDQIVECFSYDANSNISSKQQYQLKINSSLKEVPGSVGYWNYRQGNQLTEGEGITYEYNEDGQLKSKTDTKGTTYYHWNCQGQLASMKSPDGNEWFYRYDALSRRVEKRGPGTHIKFVWDGDLVLYEIILIEDEETSSTHLWEFHPRDFSPLYKLEDRQQQYFSLNDHIGTPLELVDEMGEVAWSHRLLTYGGNKTSNENEINCPIRFQGQWHDSESGLHYNRFRYFDSSTGRFLTHDPLSLNGGTNKYLYTPNPARFVDVLGLTSGPCPVKLGLGLKDKKKGLDYKEWSEENGFKIYSELGGRGTFDEQIRRSMDAADEIHFNLEGVDPSTAHTRLNEYEEPVRINGRSTYTDYELGLIRDTPEYREKVIWHNGENPFPD